jgi:hypothetical protein
MIKNSEAIPCRLDALVVRKICHRCGIEKGLEDFHKNKSNADGRHYYCKTCTNTSNSKWRNANKKRMYFLKKQWCEINKPRVLENEKKRRKKEIEKCSNRYIVSKLRQLSPELKTADIPAEVIDLKRKVIQLKREQRRIENGH